MLAYVEFISYICSAIPRNVEGGMWKEECGMRNVMI